MKVFSLSSEKEFYAILNMSEYRLLTIANKYVVNRTNLNI